MSDPKNLFWDSCVFVRYITRAPNDLLWDIDEFVNDAKKGLRKIYYSTLIYTEIKPSHLKVGGMNTIYNFIEDFEGVFEPIDPTPSIMADVGIMRDLKASHPVKTSPRVLGTPDAIHLATCVHVRDTLGVSNVVFHTFDQTPGTGWEGKTIPIIGLEQWYGDHMAVRQIADACGLPRTRPEYPQPGLFAPGKPAANDVGGAAGLAAATTAESPEPT